MKKSSWGLALLGVGAWMTVACNTLTGSDDLVVFDDDNDGPSTTGAGGATNTSNATTGNGVTSSNAQTTGAATTNVGATTGAVTTTNAVTSTGSGMSTCAGWNDTTSGLDAEEQTFVQLINDYRSQNGVGPITACHSLNRAAQAHSEDMRDADYFDHTGQNGSSPWSRSCDACFQGGCGPSTAMGENIAAGNPGAQGTFDQWRNSPGHNANMLQGNFTTMGIGRATGGGMYGSYWTNVFAGDEEATCQ